MEGLGQDRKTLITGQVPLPSTIDGIIRAVRQILLKGHIYSINVAKDQPITYERPQLEEEELSPGDAPDLSGLSPYEVARQGNLVEFNPKLWGLDKEAPIAQVAWMMTYIEKHKMLPTHLLVAESTNFWSWLGLPRERGNKLTTFLGMQVEKEQEFPSSVFLLFGGEDKLAAAHEAKIIIKGTC